MDALQLKIRSIMPLAYVLEQYGHSPVEATGERLHYLNPWRDDERASLDIYWEDGNQGRHQRAGDYAEDDSWDVFALVGKLMEHETGEEPDFGEIRLRTMELYFQWSNDTEWDEPEIQSAAPRTPMGEELERQLLSEAREAHYSSTEAWLSAAASRPGMAAATQISRTKLFSRTEDGALVYLVHHPLTNELMGVSYRDADGRKWQEKGSSRFLSTPATQHELAFGDQENYILVEGETDLFSTYATFGDTHYVWGVPGAGMHPGLVGGDLIPEGASVTLAFDMDEAGRQSMLKWQKYLSGRGVSVRIAVVPDGKDMATLRPEEQRRVITSAQPFVDPPSTVQELDTGYWRVRGKDEVMPGWAKEEMARQITTWTVRFNAVLVGEKGEVVGYRGKHFGREVVLPAEALNSTNQLHKWSGTVGGSLLTRGEMTIGELGQYIRHQGNFLPRIPAYHATGLHNGGFVWDDGYTGIAEATVRPMPGRTEVNFPADGDAEYVQWLKEGGPAEAYDGLVGAYSSNVSHPLLAWMTAAFIRSLAERFPVLMVQGLSGTGKTTILSRYMRAFYGNGEPISVDSITQYAMTVALEGSNAFPMWIDEYRNSTQRAKLDALGTAILDVNAGAARASSAGGNDWATVNVHPRQSPLLVSGEMGLHQLAHIERSANVNLNDGQRGDIKPLSHIPPGAIGRLIMDYLVRTGRSSKPPISVTLAMDKSRPELTQAVLEAGWHIFIDALLNPSIPEAFPDLDFNAQDAVNAASGVMSGERVDVALDQAMEAVYSGKQNAPAMWLSADGEYLYVNIPNLVNEVGRRHDLSLPSSRDRDLSASMHSYYSSERDTVVPPKHLWPDNQNRIRVHRISTDALEWAGKEQQ